MSPCRQCGGEKLLFKDWAGPTPTSPHPPACPICASGMSPREKQVLLQVWLLDNQSLPLVQSILSRMAAIRGPDIRLLVHYPTLRKLESMDLRLVAEADMVVGYGNVVLKNRNQIAGYALSETEFRRLREDAGEYRRMP